MLAPAWLTKKASYDSRYFRRVERSDHDVVSTSAEKTGDSAANSKISAAQRHRRQPTIGRSASPHGRLLAGGQLSRRRPDLSLRQSSFARALEANARQAAAPGPLGHHARTELRLRASQSRDLPARPGHDLHLRSRARRTRARGQHVSRRHVLGALSAYLAGRRGTATIVQAILLSRRNSQPRRPGNAGLDPRRGRIGLQPQPCLRRRVRQSAACRRLRHWRRRSRNGTAGHQLARQQVPQPGHGWRRATDPAPQRLQDRQPDDTRRELETRNSSL